MTSTTSAQICSYKTTETAPILQTDTVTEVHSTTSNPKECESQILFSSSQNNGPLVMYWFMWLHGSDAALYLYFLCFLTSATVCIVDRFPQLKSTSTQCIFFFSSHLTTVIVIYSLFQCFFFKHKAVDSVLTFFKKMWLFVITCNLLNSVWK